MADLPLFDPFKVLAEVRQRAAAELPQKLPQHPAEEITHLSQSVSPSSAASATSAGSDARPGTRARPRVKEEEGKNLLLSDTYARASGALDARAEHEHADPAEVAEAAIVSLSLCDEREKQKITAAEVLDDGLRKWRSGLESLSADRIPCPGYRPEEWARTLSRALSFVDMFGSQAEALGWTAPRLFGVHPKAGIVRVDACGALVLPGSGQIRAITASEIRFERNTHREKPGQPEGVPLWSFSR